MGAARYEILSTLPPGAGARTRLAWSTGDAGFRRAVVLREVPDGAEAVVGVPTPEGVLPLLDMVELEGRRWAVYEFVPGATFAEVANAHFSVERLPSLGLIGRVVVDACHAIHRVHVWVDPLGLIGPQRHGGLSDQSVFVGFDGVARVLDFNARRLGRFIAPEVTRGDQFDARADVFSLGALLHHATTRFEKGYAVTMARAPSPSEFPPPSTVHPEASPELDAVVMCALMPSPASRFSSALQLAEEIEKVLGPTLFTHEQVCTVLGPLFGDRIAALKELVDPKKRPPAPRASAPRVTAARPSAPPVRKSNSALDAVSAMSGDVMLDGGGVDDLEDLPTQANIKLPPGLVRTAPPVPDYDPHATGPGMAAPKPDFDPHATTPGRSLKANSGTDPELPPAPVRPSGPKTQTAAEKALAIGQEDISTGQFRALNVALDGSPSLGDDEEVPTNVRPRPSQAAMAALAAPPAAAADDGGEDEADDAPLYEDPKKKEPTLDVDPAERPPKPEKKKGRGGLRVMIAVLLLGIVGGAAVTVLRPDVVERAKAALNARLHPGAVEPAQSPVEEIPLEDVVLLEDGGVAPVLVAGDEDGGHRDAGVQDGGEEEEEEEEVSLLPSDAGLHADGGAGKHGAPTHKKKKKKRRY